MAEAKKRIEPQYRQLAVTYAAAYVVLSAGVFLGILGRMPHVHSLHTVLGVTTTSPHELNRTDPVYWLTGNGDWSARWEGTNKDTWLAVASIVATLWMVCEYWRYAINCGHVFQQLQTSVAKSHVLQLRRVFMQSMLIHTCTGILVWWVPAFWVIVVLTVINAWQTRQLNTANIQVLHANELVAVTATTAATLQVLNDSKLDIHTRLDQAKTLLMQRVPYADN